MATAGGPTASDRAEPGPIDAGRAEVITALEWLVEGYQLPGAQVVVTENGRDWTASAGAGNLEHGTPFPDDARVRIGSNTKTFVATVMLQLVAEGKVELDAPVERYLPGVVHGPGIDGNRITIRNLLQHTSGIPEYAAEESGVAPKPGQLDSHQMRWVATDMAEVVRTALTAPADFEPGAQWAYSNTNYALAAMVIEQLTGASIGAEIAHRILEPLGLRDTYYPDPDETDIRGPHPVGYSKIDGTLIDYTSQNVSWAGAAGAMVGTGADLNRFFTALLDGELLPPEQLTEMKHSIPLEVPGPRIGYGLGLIYRELSCGKGSWGHGGDIDGFETRGGVTSDGRSVTVSVNQIPEASEGMADVMRVVDAALCATT
ncbi:beta-lactamase family protein [Nocardia uniformis]|uniref:Beta-lactamase family protein n=2 Tax=Nocardia uniformis TaxID=53432 RepID=A0A849CA77_9NOCA|nr:beta-lactamase family protein [Nocardia uniformis]